ncbi:MAG: hypothetical protein LAO03_03905 [Acidobacteriia bacterium]|nr:hypothetical protein [Terriglobia bacterium]
MMKPIADLLGWAGALILLSAYGAVSFRRIRPESGLYQFCNGLGGIFLVVNTVYYHAYPSAFVNVVWIAIALAARARVKARSAYPQAADN